jgi:hypothetical protein
VFRTILAFMAELSPASVVKNLWAVPELGRYDDFLVLLDSPVKEDVLACIKAQLASDIQALDGAGAVSMLGKWLPSVNAHNADAIRYGKTIARALGMSEAEYRRTLSRLRAKIAIIENDLREKDYAFDYAKQPSRALLKYRKVFLRNDGARYQAFLDSVAEGRGQSAAAYRRSLPLRHYPAFFCQP